MKSMREDLKAVERLRKTAEQLSRQERDKSHAVSYTHLDVYKRQEVGRDTS